METSGKEDVTTADPARLEAGSTPPVPAKQDRYIGRTIDGRYVVESLIGEGGMGFVYRARHKVIDKRVAIKILKTEASREQEMTERFLQEAKSASAIGNPHIVDISDFGQLPDGATYFVMEYLDGKSLGAHLEANKGKAMPVPRLVHIAKQIAAGLSGAHEAAIVHRDLKPDNVMLVGRGKDQDFVKILDFGIAKVLGGESQKITRAGSVFGTPHYMSPEQAAGTPVDQRTDIYALGVIMYEMASGRVPFDADNFMGILTQHMYRAPVPILALVPPPGDVPPGLDAIVLKCLSKKPEQRYANMQELIDDLQRLEQGNPPVAVHEMMSRSGGFNVPQDYFRARTSAMPEAVPATPAGLPTRTRWPLLMVIFAGIGVGAFALTLTLVASKPSGAKPAASVTAAPTATSAPSATQPVSTAIEAPARQVLITIDPVDAKLLKDGAALDGPPFAVNVPAGASIELVAKKPGYKDQPLTLDDKSEARMLVKMQALAAGGGKPGRPAASAGGGAGTKPGGAKKPCDITDKNCDPWK